MKKNLLLHALFFTILFTHSQTFSTTEQQLPFDKVIIWGHKLHSHTHSYIHYAFYKTFKYLGYDTYWLDSSDDISSIDFSNSLFFTEGQVDQDIPLRADCRYILHNCNDTKYEPLLELRRCINLQVYTHKYRQYDVKEIAPYTLIDVSRKYIYMPWGTDLLPHEIDKIKKNIQYVTKKPRVYFVGTIMGGAFNNVTKWLPFIQACRDSGIRFSPKLHISTEKNIELMQKSLIAPAIQGEWQIKEGYIPCGIFKNISYGAMGVTNSKAVYDLFKGKIVYNPDTYQLFFDAKKRVENMTLDELYELMDFVKEKHTYINRIKHLLDFLHLIKPLDNYQS